MNLEKIASFQVDHTRLMPGMYLSRVDGDVVTYDIRFVQPNQPPFLASDAMHTIEHLFATFVRSSRLRDGILYFGPMGCRTGFYFLTRGISHEDAVTLTCEALAFIAGYDGPIPGTSAVECGNYLEHNLPLAREYAATQKQILEGWSAEMLEYTR